MSRRSEEIDFSGDVGIQASGGDRRDLFAAVTEGLLRLMHGGDVIPAVERRIEVTSSTPEDTLVDWLSEVIATAATHGEVYGDVYMDSVEACAASGVLSGEPIDETRHELRFDVKAATYHGLEYEESDEGYRCRVIFDL